MVGFGCSHQKSCCFGVEEVVVVVGNFVVEEVAVVVVVVGNFVVEVVVGCGCCCGCGCLLHSLLRHLQQLLRHLQRVVIQ